MNFKKEVVVLQRTGKPLRQEAGGLHCTEQNRKKERLRYWTHLNSGGQLRVVLRRLDELPGSERRLRAQEARGDLRVRDAQRPALHGERAQRHEGRKRERPRGLGGPRGASENMRYVFGLDELQNFRAGL